MGRSSRSTGLTGQFPTSAEQFFLAYAESVSAVDFLIRTHGQDALVSLIRSYADGRTDDEAFTAAIGMDMAAFDAAWMADLGAETPGPLRTAAGRGGTGTRCLGRRRRPDREQRPGRRGLRSAPLPGRRGHRRAGSARWPPTSDDGGAAIDRRSSRCWSSSLVVGRRVDRAPARSTRNQRHDPDGPPPVHPQLAADAGGGVAGARVPRRRPAGRPGTTGPLHDPGADAAGRDRRPSCRPSRSSSRRRSSTCGHGSRRPSRQGRGRPRSCATSTTSSRTPGSRPA